MNEGDFWQIYQAAAAIYPVAVAELQAKYTETETTYQRTEAYRLSVNLAIQLRDYMQRRIANRAVLSGWETDEGKVV